MSEGAILARFLGKHNEKVFLEPLVPRGIPLTICAKHPELVYYDAQECPCCVLMKENRDNFLRK